MQIKVVELTRFKADGADAGEFAGLLSPYGNVDDGGEVVDAGAYDADIRVNGNTRPLLWQHHVDEPIGEITVQNCASGLRCAGKLLMLLPTAQRAFLLMKAGIVRGLSIGFDTVQDSISDGVRHLTELKLYEGSIVTFPMNNLALISDVKSRYPTSSYKALSSDLAAANRQIAEARLMGRFDDLRKALKWRM